MKTYIVMADIIDSRRQPSKKLMRDFQNVVMSINSKYRKHLLSPLTITLGDEFQGVMKSYDSALGLILEMEEEIVKQGGKFKLRYVLNYGDIETKLNHEIAYGMMGRGLTKSREALEELKDTDVRFLVILDSATDAEIMNNLFKLYDRVISDWKGKDLDYVKLFLEDKTYQEVASELGVNLTSAWRRQKSLKMEDYYICKSLILKIAERK
jgi:hypothetical protein